MDLFEEYLDRTDLDIVEIALTDKSYKHYYQELNCKDYDGEYNKNLATYGDAILKVCFLKNLLESNEPLPTVAKQKYESDEALVKKIASKYDLLNKMKYDKNDPNKPNNYDFIKKKASKYIATCVEAMIAAIYLDMSKMSVDKAMIELQKLTKQWQIWCD